MNYLDLGIFLSAKTMKRKRFFYQNLRKLTWEADVLTAWQTLSLISVTASHYSVIIYKHCATFKLYPQTCCIKFNHFRFNSSTQKLFKKELIYKIVTEFLY